MDENIEYDTGKMIQGSYEKDIVLNSDELKSFSINQDIRPKYLTFNHSKSHKELLTIRELDDGNAKLVFNKEAFPQYTSDDFAREFIDILEREVIKKWI